MKRDEIAAAADGNGRHDSSIASYWYFVCPCCEAKWFYQQQTSLYPCCWRRNWSAEQLLPPWLLRNGQDGTGPKGVCRPRSSGTEK